MRRILIANDLGPAASNAQARAIRLAAAQGAAVRIVHAAVEPDQRALRRRLSAEARMMTGKLAAHELDVSIRFSAADPATAILFEADRFDANLIVLGGHGEPRFRDAVFGTTASHVVRHAIRPVLIVQNQADEPYSTVLAAIDESHSARPILDTALAIAPACSLFAVHAFYPSLRQTLAGQDALDREEQRQEEELERLLAEALAGRSAGRALTAKRHAEVETGEALSLIMSETERILPDLLAMGTRRRASFLGSHAVDTLFWCPCDLLVVPERDGATQAGTLSA